jgi:protein required for attachment to host cells
MLHLIVADSKVARILGVDFDGALIEMTQLVNESAVAHERDLVTDRPGRMIAPGSGARVSLAPKTSARATSLQRWLKSVAAQLRAFVASSSSEGLVLVASPRLLALLRSVLPAEVKKQVLLEIPRDLAKQSLTSIQKRLTPTLRAAVKRARHSPSPNRTSMFRAGD